MRSFSYDTKEARDADLFCRCHLSDSQIVSSVYNVDDVVVYWLSLPHNFIQQSLNSGSAQIQVLLVACRKFVLVRISYNDLGLIY